MWVAAKAEHRQQPAMPRDRREVQVLGAGEPVETIDEGRVGGRDREHAHHWPRTWLQPEADHEEQGCGALARQRQTGSTVNWHQPRHWSPSRTSAARVRPSRTRCSFSARFCTAVRRLHVQRPDGEGTGRLACRARVVHGHTVSMPAGNLPSLRPAALRDKDRLPLTTRSAIRGVRRTRARGRPRQESMPPRLPSCVG